MTKTWLPSWRGDRSGRYFRGAAGTARRLARPPGTGDLLVVPDSRHAVQAVEDSAILLTVGKAG